VERDPRDIRRLYKLNGYRWQAVRPLANPAGLGRGDDRVNSAGPLPGGDA
jgi:hypothetical protein